MKTKITIAILLLTAFVLPFSVTSEATGNQAQTTRKDIYHNGWIDLNKNGRMDVYENSRANINARVEDLLRQMNLDEKTCQTATLYGVGRGRTNGEVPLKDELP